MYLSLKKSLSKIFSLIIVLCFLLCGCKNGKEASSALSSADTESSFVTESLESESSDVSSVESAPATDALDPQNTENPNGTGTKVKAQQLTAKTGKANGIDVSKWQGKIDWQSVKKAGIDFVIIRIGYRAENGTIYKDPNADYNIQQADKAGILVGVYFFSTAVNTDEAVAEAKWTAEAIKGYPISYPVVYDCEGFLQADSRMYSLTNSQRTDNALAFLGQIKKSGYEGMFYASKGQLENSVYWDTSRIESSYKIWVAHYPSVTYPSAETPDYGGKYDMWQYTNMGSVSGIKGNTDMVVSYFTKQKAAPKSNVAPKTAAAPTEKDSVYTAVNETVTAKDTVNLRVSASTSSNIVGSLKNGEKLTRTAVGTNGWSKLTYNGQTVYAISSYLTTDLSYKAPVESQPVSDGYTAVNETVTAKDAVNLRDAAGMDSNVVGKLKNGETATRIGINNTNGWSKLDFNGQTVYAISSYLTTDLSYKAPVESQPVSDGYTAVNETVTAKDVVNLRDAAGMDSNVVGKLKNGETATRIGINNTNGWSRLDFNGQTVYAISSYLTTDLSSKAPAESQAESEENEN